MLINAIFVKQAPGQKFVTAFVTDLKNALSQTLNAIYRYTINCSYTHNGSALEWDRIQCTMQTDMHIKSWTILQ